MAKSLDDAYQAYVEKYIKNLRQGRRNGMTQETVDEIRYRMLTRSEFQENIEILRDEIRAEGRKASSATKLGQKIANDQTRLRSEKQVKALRGAFKELKERGLWEGDIPTSMQIRYSENQKFFDILKAAAESQDKEYDIYASEVFGS